MRARMALRKSVHATRIVGNAATSTACTRIVSAVIRTNTSQPLANASAPLPNSPRSLADTFGIGPVARTRGGAWTVRPSLFGTPGLAKGTRRWNAKPYFAGTHSAGSRRLGRSRGHAAADRRQVQDTDVGTTARYQQAGPEVVRVRRTDLRHPGEQPADGPAQSRPDR